MIVAKEMAAVLRRSVMASPNIMRHCVRSNVSSFHLAAAAPTVPKVGASARPKLVFATPRARMATVGSDGTDSDFAPKAKEPAATSDRDVQVEIKEMVSNRKVVLFMKGTPDFPMCGFSNRAVQILDHHKTTYGAFNVLEDTEVREGIKKYSSWPTIPQLFVDGEFIGGCDIMMEMHESGELSQVLNDAGAVRK